MAVATKRTKRMGKFMMWSPTKWLVPIMTLAAVYMWYVNISFTWGRSDDGKLVEFAATTVCCTVDATSQEHNQKIKEDAKPSELLLGVDANSNRRNPWDCRYFDNANGEGNPLATLSMVHLASDWQEKPGWEYDGVPILNYSKSGFFLKCRSNQTFARGTYVFTPFINLDYFIVTLDGKDMYHNKALTRKGNQVNSIDLNPIYFDVPSDRIIEVTAGVVTEQRSWIMFSWTRIHGHFPNPIQSKSNDFSDLEKVACLTSPICYGPRAKCSNLQINGLSSSESPWGLCKDYYLKNATPETKHCLVYSFGIRDIYTTELLYGREGCEVHAFDCTVNYNTNLGPNVTFHPWCLGTNSSELKLDGKLARSVNNEFMDLPSIIKHLGHEERELSILKADCEGCEWAALDSLIQEMPKFFSRIHMLLLELHFVTNSFKGQWGERLEELKTMSRVADALQNYRTYSFSVNTDLSRKRFSDPVYFEELYNHGLFVGACCYEFSMVRRDLIN